MRKIPLLAVALYATFLSRLGTPIAYADSLYNSKDVNPQKYVFSLLIGNLMQDRTLEKSIKRGPRIEWEMRRINVDDGRTSMSYQLIPCIEGKLSDASYNVVVRKDGSRIVYINGQRTDGYKADVILNHFYNLN